MNKEIKYKTKTLPYDQGLLVSNFFITAFDDYIAARLLLINGLLPQGCIMANTSIEKYFKGLLASQSVTAPKHHDISAPTFKKSIKNKFKKIYDIVNWEFIDFLAKSYEIRYLDSLPREYNIAIIRAKTLAELDYIVCAIEENFKIIYPKFTGRDNKYRTMINENDPKLLNYNFYLLKYDKNEFVQQVDDVFEFRKMTNGEVLEIRYRTDKIKNDGKFLYEAIKPKEDNPTQSFSVCFEPINP